jgi:short-subunit dehydrogenase
MSGLMPHPGAVIYTTSKAAIIGMMEAMRGELEGRGVICSAFCPGAVQSNIAEAGKTRPAALADTGYAESDKRRQGHGDVMHLFMTKEEVGERVREGIENDELYICTHQEFRDGVRDRAGAMVASIPDRAENADYKTAFAMLFRNPIHAAETARQNQRNGRTG